MTGVSPEWVHGNPQAAGTNLINPAGWFTEWAQGGAATDSGAHVTPEKALTYTAVYASVSLIAGTIAALPLRIKQRVSATVTNDLPDHPLYAFFNVQFNADMTALGAREAGCGHVLTWGNSYVQIVKSRAGKVLELRPIPPDMMEPRRDKDGTLKYDIMHNGKVELTLDSEEVLHVPALGYDGVRGYSPVAVARQAIGLGLAAEKFGSKFFAQSARPSGYVKFPDGKGFKTDQARLRFREDFERAHAGTDNMGRVVILEDGATWQAIGIPPEDAQFLETRQFQRSEINAIYRTPPHLTGDVTVSTSWGTGIEEQGIAFVVHTLQPWLTRIEQEYKRKLLGVNSPLFFEHDVSSLLRGDVVKRTDALCKRFDRGMLTVNEGRHQFGDNPIPGGDRSFVAVNMIPLNAVGKEETEDPPPAKPAPVKPKAETDRSARLAESLRDVFRESLARCVRRECQAARRAAGKPAQFSAWVEEFYAEHELFVAEQLRPVLVAWWAAFPLADMPPDAAVDFARRFTKASRHTLAIVADPKSAKFAQDLGALLDGWEADRAILASAELRTQETSHAA